MKAGTIITAGTQTFLILGTEGDRFAVAPVVPLQRRRLAGEVVLDQGIARTSQAQMLVGLPAGAAEIERASAALLAECVRQATRTASAEAGLRRFRPLAAERG